MKKAIVVLVLCVAFVSHSQTSEKENVKTAITQFFEAFHKQDTSALKSMVSPTIKLQSVSTNKLGKTVIHNDSFNEFLKGLASIPKDNAFEEKLLSFNIQVDANMAHVWTPYEFWYMGKFSHCGVNSFQLIKENNHWKIIYLIDTRRRRSCREE